AASQWCRTLSGVVLPSTTRASGRSDIRRGSPRSARQLPSGTMTLPAGIAADSFARHRAAILASALLFMGLGYFCFGTASRLAGAILGGALVGLGTATWHPPAMGALPARFPSRRAPALSIHAKARTVFITPT